MTDEKQTSCRDKSSLKTSDSDELKRANRIYQSSGSEYTGDSQTEQDNACENVFPKIPCKEVYFARNLHNSLSSNKIIMKANIASTFRGFKDKSLPGVKLKTHSVVSDMIDDRFMKV